MPTSKPRITITLTEQQHALLQQLAGFQGESMSSIVVDLIETAVPVMERIATVMHAASIAPQEMLHGLKESMERAEQDVLSQIQEQMDMLAALVSEAGVGDGGTALAVPPSAAPAPAPVARKGRPPTSNRGVRIPPPSPVSPMKTSTSPAKRSGARK